MHREAQRIREVFVAAVKLPPEGWATFLNEACAGDPALRTEVDQLLKAHQEAGIFLQRPLPGELAGQLERLAPAIASRATLGSGATPVGPQPGPSDTFVPVSGVLGDFQIVREIGRGGMGVVYEVIDGKQGVGLALKVLRDPTAAAVLRLKREFRSLANLGHRNLVVLDRLFCSDRKWFFTMELIRGRNYTEYVCHPVGPAAATARLPPETESALDATKPRKPASCRGDVHYARLRRALEQVAMGLGALHQAGMLHRDVKPSNVLVSEEGRVVLVDFGLVAELKEAYSSEAGPRTWGGTQPYMSPEQMAAQPLTYASDWYSVGVMLYQSLSGRLPFEGQAAEVLSQKRAGPPPGLLDEVPPDQRDLEALCIDLLQPDPGRRPTGSEVLRRIRRRGNEDQALGLQDAQDGPPVFVGRQRQLAELQRALDDVRAGLSLRVYVSGKPGMGKTALVQRFLCAAAAAADVVVVQGRCYEREAMPYKALDSLVDALVCHLNALPAAEVDQLLPDDLCSLIRVFPALRHVARLAAAASRGTIPLDDRESRTRAIGSLRGLLKGLADRAPTILVVDDLQWGDLDSAAFLSELLAPPDPPRLLFVACYRSDDRRRSECLEALLPEEKTAERGIHEREIVVDELTREEAQELAVTLLGTDGPLAVDLAAISPHIGGSPYLISEFAHRAKREGRQMLPAEGRPVDLASMLTRRIEQLPSEARRLLATIAVSGHPIRLDLACQVAGLGLAPAVAVALLRSENLIRTLADAAHKVVAYHDCIREAATAGLPLPERNRLHLQIASVLEGAADVDPAELCHRFESAGDYDKAGHYALVAAESAARALAFDRAAAMYRAAIQWRKPRAEEQWLLRRKLADALSHGGRSAEAAEEYAALANCEDRMASREMQRAAAMHYLISGHIESGRVWLDRVLKDVGIPVPKSRWQIISSIVINRTRLWWRGLGLGPPRNHRRQIDQARLDAYWCAIVGLGMVDQFRAAYYVARNLLLALRHGDAGLAARALAMEAFLSGLAAMKARRRTQDLLGRAAMLSEQAGDPYARALLELARGAAALGEDDFAAGFAHCRDSERSFREHCRFVFWELSTAQAMQLAALTWLGRFNELARRLRQTLDEAKERGDLYTPLSLVELPHTLLQLVADKPERAEREIDAILARWSSHGPWQYIVCLVGRAHVAMYRGLADQALEMLEEARTAMRGSLQWRMQGWRVTFKESRARALLIAARTARDRQPLLEAAARLGRSLQRESGPKAAAFAPLVQAPLAFYQGRREQAAAHLENAVAGFERTGIAMYAAAARHRLGQLLGGEAGNEMVAQAEAWMKNENVVNVQRITDLFCPWIEDQG